MALRSLVLVLALLACAGYVSALSPSKKAVAKNVAKKKVAVAPPVVKKSPPVVVKKSPPVVVKKSPPPPKAAPPPAPGSKRVVNFLAACRKAGATKYANIAESSGFNETLRSVLQSFDLTLFVPLDKAFARPLTNNQKILAQILAFHTFYPPLRYRVDLNKLPVGAKLLTLDNQLTAFRINAKSAQAQFNGRTTDSSGAQVLSTFYTDLGSPALKTKTLLAHSVDVLMNPSKIF